MLLEPVEDGTHVLLRHHKLEGASAAQHTVGWVHYLARLQIAAAGGDPGVDNGPAVGEDQGSTP